MYNREVVVKNILGYERSSGIKLIEYPVDQVRYYVDHFDKLTVKDDKKGAVKGFKRGLTPDEVAFINNERQMCRLDLSYEIARYEFVEDVISAELKLMTLNKAQKIALKIIGDMELRGVPIILLFLKARQLGVSTFFAKIIKHRMEFVPFTKAVVASGDEEKTRSLVEKMIEKPHAMLPWWLVRHDVEFKYSGDEFMVIPSADSMLLVQHGRQELGIARGNTANTWLFSELLEWLDPKSTLEAGFNKAVHPSARTFGVEETTAGNRGSWLHRHWEECSADYPEGRSNIFPVFLPYFVGDDIYPPPGYFPITESWEAPDFVKAHAESCEKYVHTSPVLSEVLGANWKLSRDQQWWFFNEYSKAIKDPESFANFLAETPSDPRSAFQSRSRSVISAQKLQELQASMNPLFTAPLWISGPEIPEVSTPPSKEKSVLKVTYESRGLYREWKLHPAEFTNVEECAQWQHRLWVWEPPKENHKYVVSVDCGGGVQADRTAIQVVRIGNGSMPAVQVAEYGSDSANAFDVVGLVLMLLTWYSPMSVTGERNWAMAAPEDAADGKTIIHELRKWGWQNIYIRQTPENRARGAADGSLLGWHTDQGNRLTLINWFLKFVKEGRLQLNSPWLLDELRTFVRTEKKSMTSSAVTYKVQHDYDSHDDLIFSMAIAIVCGHQIDIYDDVANTQWAAVAQAIEKQIEVPKHNFNFKLTAWDIPEAKGTELVKQKPLQELQF